MGWIRYGSLLLFLGVCLGAFGAHGLKDPRAPDAREAYRTAVLYHLIHGLGLLAVGWLTTVRPGEELIGAAGWLFVAGIVLFSGSLYALALTGLRKLGVLTPVGGLAFLAGWLCLALAAR